jgi:hypothetical protein
LIDAQPVGGAVQTLTVRELLDGKKRDLPLLILPAFQQAQKVDQLSPGQVELFG